MAKGQLRSSREAKKPKQPKQANMVSSKPSTSTVTPLRAPGATAAKKK